MSLIWSHRSDFWRYLTCNLFLFHIVTFVHSYFDSLDYCCQILLVKEKSILFFSQNFLKEIDISFFFFFYHKMCLDFALISDSTWQILTKTDKMGSFIKLLKYFACNTI